MKNTLPKLHGHFGRGTNATKVSIAGRDVYFSYETPIAFVHPKRGLIVRQNDWSVTTGGHLNAIDGGSREAKKTRIPGAEFEKLLAEAFN